MKLKEIFNVNSRENRIVHLQSVSEQNLDIFSEAISRTEGDMKNEITKADEKIKELNGKLSNYPEENDNIPTDDDLEIFDEMFDYHYDQNLFNEYLVSFAEMKIVYFFKSLEINMKSLIQLTYPNVKTKSFFQWENMTSFFKNRDIKISEITGYQEAIQLRKVNNCIKHTNEISDEIKKITEFESLDLFTPKSIDVFHFRIKDKVKEFFKELTNAVIKDLYEFDLTRIENLSNEYSNRMDDANLRLFIERLNSKLE